MPAQDELDLPAPTAPESFQVSIRGFADEPQARAFANLIAVTVREISRFIDLERLDGVTVADDYDEALAQLDRGYQATQPLTRTADDRLLGVGMAPAVLRAGTVKGHLVFYAPVIRPLREDSGSQFRQALYLVAHECGHIEDLKHRDECFPGVILRQRISDGEDAVLDQLTAGVWEEYAACRISARFGPEQASIYENSFLSVLLAARDDANAAIRSYRQHRDINQVLEEGGSRLCEPLRLAAYLLGHLDGLDEGWNAALRARDVLAGSPYRSFVDRLTDVLRDLWSRRGHWHSTAEFTPLHDLGREVLAHGGLILHRLPDGTLYVDIPFAPEIKL